MPHEGKERAMKITRRFTEAGKSPYATIKFRRAISEIKNPDGSTVFRLDGIEVPEHWSQVAADILAQKYFRKAGVPRRLKRCEETQVPSWLWRSVADEPALNALPESERISGESDARQVFDRLAGTWTYWVPAGPPPMTSTSQSWAALPEGFSCVAGVMECGARMGAGRADDYRQITPAPARAACRRVWRRAEPDQARW